LADTFPDPKLLQLRQLHHLNVLRDVEALQSGFAVEWLPFFGSRKLILDELAIRIRCPREACQHVNHPLDGEELGRVLVQLPGEVAVPQVGVIIDVGYAPQLVTAVLQTLVIERGRVKIESIEVCGSTGALYTGSQRFKNGMPKHFIAGVLKEVVKKSIKLKAVKI